MAGKKGEPHDGTRVVIELAAAVKRGRFSLEAALKLDGHVTGVFGPSGSGKSTLLHILAGLIRPDSGRVVVNGRVLLDSAAGIDVPVHCRHVGLVFQDSRLFPHRTVRGNLRYGYDLLPAGRRLFGFAQVVEMLELERLLEQKSHQLSGGEKQRVAIGRALLSSPGLLLLDEPLASLDYRLKDQILPFLKRVAEEINIPMLYVSHAIDEILHLTSDIVVIEHGRILAQGEFHKLLRQHDALRLTQSLGLENVLRAAVVARDDALGHVLVEHHGRRIVVPPCGAQPGAAVSVCVAASDIALSLRPVEGVTIQNQIPGVVVGVEPVASRMLVSVDIGEVVIAEVTAKAVQELRLAPGSAVYCLVKTQAIRILGSR